MSMYTVISFKKLRSAKHGFYSGHALYGVVENWHMRQQAPAIWDLRNLSNRYLEQQLCKVWSGALVEDALAEVGGDEGYKHLRQPGEN